MGGQKDSASTFQCITEYMSILLLIYLYYQLSEQYYAAAVVFFKYFSGTEIII